MGLLTRREVILAKVEVTYNTDPIPTPAADAVLIENPSWANAGARMLERPAIRSSFGTLKHVYGGSLRQVSFQVEVKGSGTIDGPPEFAALLRACGFAETINVAASVIYDPVSSALESCTIYYYQDGIVHKLTGCRGNVSGVFAAGQIGKLSFTMTGHIASEVDEALPTPTYDATVPVPVINTPFAIGAFAAKINQFTFDMQNQVTMAPDVAAADGYGQIRITGRDVAGSFDPEAELLATKNFLSEWKAGTSQALTSGVIGSAAGNRYKLDHPAVAYREIGPGDREALRTFEIGYGAAESAGNDEVKLTFT